MATIRDVMSTDVISVHPDTPVAEAIRLLIEYGISGLPVVDDDFRIVGVLSEKDVLKAFYEDARDVSALMTKNPDALAVDAPLVDAFDSLMTHNFRRLLIHDQGKLVGLISRADLMPLVLESLLERAQR